MKRAIVCGAGGFIGHHLVRRLRQEGTWVRGVDLKHPPFNEPESDEFIIGDLRQMSFANHALDSCFDEVYQLAADMGGAGYVFTGDNDADIMSNSAIININVLRLCQSKGVGRIFFASSACVYPEYNQRDPSNPICTEDSAYPAEPDSAYGWEKLFSERLYLAYARCHGMSVRIARYHNIFGPECSWDDGLEKVPAALCRKVAMCESGGSIEIWGDGQQTRSFLYIDDCIEGTLRLMRSDCPEPLNIGSDEMVTIDQLVDLIATIAKKKIMKRYTAGPVGVRGRTSDNRRVKQILEWTPKQSLAEGLKPTYAWISRQVGQAISVG